MNDQQLNSRAKVIADQTDLKVFESTTWPLTVGPVLEAKAKGFGAEKDGDIKIIVAKALGMLIARVGFDKIKQTSNISN